MEHAQYLVICACYEEVERPVTNEQKEKPMKEIKKVLIPVDFSSNTEKLVEFGFYVAKNFSASVEILYVVEPIPADAMIGSTMITDYRELAVDSANKKMKEMVADLREKHPDCSGEVVYGDPVDEIVKKAGADDSKLIVISTHGAKGLERILLGSVTERVVKRATCPVMVHNPFK